MLLVIGKTPLWEGCSTFARHSPYLQPPTSITLSSSASTNHCIMSFAFAKITSASDSKNPFAAKLNELDKESNELQSKRGYQSHASLQLCHSQAEAQ